MRDWIALRLGKKTSRSLKRDDCSKKKQDKITEHAYPVGICERSRTIVEPRASTQWFCKMKPLAEPAIAAVERGDIQIVPDNRRQELFNLLRAIRAREL